MSSENTQTNQDKKSLDSTWYYNLVEKHLMRTIAGSWGQSNPNKDEPTKHHSVRKWLINLLKLTRKKTGSSFVTSQYKSSVFPEVLILLNSYALPDYGISGAIHMKMCKIQGSITHTGHQTKLVNYGS